MLIQLDWVAGKPQDLSVPLIRGRVTDCTAIPSFYLGVRDSNSGLRLVRQAP